MDRDRFEALHRSFHECSIHQIMMLIVMLVDEINGESGHFVGKRLPLKIQSQVIRHHQRRQLVKTLLKTMDQQPVVQIPRIHLPLGGVQFSLPALLQIGHQPLGNVIAEEDEQCQLVFPFLGIFYKSLDAHSWALALLWIFLHFGC